MPPPIHRTMTVSAVGVIASVFWARIARGNPAASADSVAALARAKKSRRVRSRLISGSTGTRAASLRSRAGPRCRQPSIFASKRFWQSARSCEVGTRPSARRNIVFTSAPDSWRRRCQQALRAAMQRLRQRRAVRQLETLQRRRRGRSRRHDLLAIRAAERCHERVGVDERRAHAAGRRRRVRADQREVELPRRLRSPDARDRADAVHELLGASSGESRGRGRRSRLAAPATIDGLALIRLATSRITAMVRFRS